MNKAILTARRLLASVIVQDDVQRLAEAVGRLQDLSQSQGSSSLSQDMGEGVSRRNAPPDMAADADRLSAEGVGIRWPLDRIEILKALNSYIAEPEGQLLLEVGGVPIAPDRPSKRCEECGAAARQVECDNCGKTQFLCEGCAIEAIDEDMNDIGVCAECADDLDECFECDKLILQDAEVAIGGSDYCAKCAEESSTCDGCGDREFDKDLTRIESADRSVCDSCKSDYGYCEGCSNYYHNEDMRSDGAGDSMCSDCWDETMVTCGECGEGVPKEDANWDDDEDEYFCSDCYTGGSLHEDVTDLGVDFDRNVEANETPLAERLGTLLRMMGDRGRMPISQLKKSRPGLAASIMAELDINKLADGNSITKELVEAARDSVEETYSGLRVSLGEWGGAQRLYNKNNLVFRLDVRDLIDGDGSDASEGWAAATRLLEAAVATGAKAHPIMLESTIGWARVVPIDDTWYVEELQSDFDSDAGRIRRYIKSKGKTERLPSSVSAEDVRLGWPLVKDLLDNWEQHLLAKVADIARENGVKTLAVISKRQLDEWTRGNPPPSDYDAVGKTKSDSKRRRYYRDAPRSMGFNLEEAEIGGLKQQVWLRAASRDGLFERMARLAAFEASLGLPG